MIVMKKLFYLLLILAFIVFGCNNNYTPKPYGYYRIDFPTKEYTIFDSIGFPYSFEYPTYGKIVNDADKNAEPYWINIEFKKYNCKIYLSYKPLKNDVSHYIEDAHTLAYKHAAKADAIDEKLILDDNRKVYGLIYDIQGNAASSFQFFMTDSSKHFLRGSLYFGVQPNKDSLATAINFFQKDVLHLIETLKWKGK
jgi:gliding motility-associated lipoprotein GldD